MLRKIVLFIADGRQTENINKFKKNIGNGMVDCWCPAETEDIFRLSKDYCAEDTLFVTDHRRILEKLKEAGNYAAVFLHENNGEQDLSEADYAITDIQEITLDLLDKVYLRITGMPWTVLGTKRCIIRETTPEDVEVFYEIYASPSITYYMEDLYENPEEELAYIKEYIKKIYGFYEYGMWSIVQKESEKVIGRAGLSWREGFDIPEIGFVIAVPYQHKGYAFEVCRAILEYGFEKLEFYQIQALVKKENEASAGLCRKLGFVFRDRVEDKGEMYDRYLMEKGRLSSN